MKTYWTNQGSCQNEILPLVSVACIKKTRLAYYNLRKGMSKYDDGNKACFLLDSVDSSYVSPGEAYNRFIDIIALDDRKKSLYYSKMPSFIKSDSAPVSNTLTYQYGDTLKAVQYGQLKTLPFAVLDPATGMCDLAKAPKYLVSRESTCTLSYSDAVRLGILSSKAYTGLNLITGSLYTGGNTISLNTNLGYIIEPNLDSSGNYLVGSRITSVSMPVK